MTNINSAYAKNNRVDLLYALVFCGVGANLYVGGFWELFQFSLDAISIKSVFLTFRVNLFASSQLLILYLSRC